MHNPPPAPTAQGVFENTPLPHLLVYALEQRLSGTFELHVGTDSVATILVASGFPAKIRVTEGVAYLGEVMLELGIVNEEQLKTSLGLLAETPRLQGQIFGEMGIDPAAVEAGLRAQLERKIEHLFTLPPETVFSYFDGVDGLAKYGGPAIPHDPLAVIWRGIRQSPSWEHVDATLRKVGSHAVQISAGAQLARFQFPRAEAAAVDLLAQRPMRVVDLANAKLVGPSVAQLLVYCLVITKQVDLVETASMRPQPRGPLQQPGKQAPILPGQQVARVQLQTMQRNRPAIVEEVAPVNRSNDGRIASPVPPNYPQDVPPPATAIAPPPPVPDIPEAAPAPMAGGFDIGAMINSTIQSSMPPPMAAMVPQAPPRPPSGQMQAVQPGSVSAMPAAGAPLTAEQNALKSKIVERAIGISSQNYYQMLGLDSDASIEAVQKAFIQLAKVWHPDRLPAALVDVKDACSKVFTHLTEAHATLTDPQKRLEYTILLKEGGATPDDQAKIQAVLEAATDFQKAEFLLKRGDDKQAYELAKKAHQLDGEQADYLAMVTWLDAQQPQWLGREKTLEKIAILDRCIRMNQNCHRAYFWRGMLYKRIDEPKKAVSDFRKVADLDPRNLDAAREVRLYNIRGGTKPPGPSASPGQRASKPPQPETLGGLFGKLFKK